MRQAHSLGEARKRFNSAAGRMKQLASHEYPLTVEIQSGIKLYAECFHWGKEIVRHGGHREDFREMEWLATALGVKPKPFYKQWAEKLFG